VASATYPLNLIRLVPAKEAGRTSSDDAASRIRGGARQWLDLEVRKHKMTTTYGASAPASMPDTHWRTRVVAVIGVAFGVVFWAWGVIWNGPLAVLSTFALPIRDLGYAVWLIPAVLAPLIIRKPGAALFAEMVAAGLSALMGTVWGPEVLLAGFVQGAAAELVFGFTLYRIWSFPVLAVAAVASAAAAWIVDWVVYYAAIDTSVQIIRLLFMAISAVVIVAGGSLALHRSLKRAGVLEGFPD
jgi:energy-coupling factor transport system substrate-specific component